MKRIIILGLVVILVAAAWTGAWFWGASQITAYEKTLEAADGVTTPKLACGHLVSAATRSASISPATMPA